MLSLDWEIQGHIQRGILRILRALAYPSLLAFCRPSPPDRMRVISGTGRGARDNLFGLHESNFIRFIYDGSAPGVGPHYGARLSCSVGPTVR
jgi:hypothetical protein